MREEKDVTKDYLAEYFKNKVEPEIDYFMKDRSSKFKAALDTAGDQGPKGDQGIPGPTGPAGPTATMQRTDPTSTTVGNLTAGANIFGLTALEILEKILYGTAYNISTVTLSGIPADGYVEKFVPFTLRANVTNNDDVVTSVKLYQDSTLLGTINTAPYENTISGLTAGS